MEHLTTEGRCSKGFRLRSSHGVWHQRCRPFFRARECRRISKVVQLAVRIRRRPPYNERPTNPIMTGIKIVK